MRESRRKRVRRLARLAAAGVGIGAVTLWFGFHRIPVWYRPVAVEANQKAQARAEVTRWIDAFSGAMVNGSPFDVEIDDREINDWLTVLPDVWPEAAEELPPQIREPVVRVSTGHLQLGAHCTHRGWETILGLEVSVDVTGDGETLVATLKQITCGSLSVPRALAASFVDPALRQNAARQSSKRPRPRHGGHGFSDVRSVHELFDGLSVENRFVWPNGRRAFRVGSLTLLDGGRIRATIVPLR